MKYRSKKTTVDGIKFDSKLEANRYVYLKHLQDKGIISGLTLQAPIQLIDAQDTPKGVKLHTWKRKKIAGTIYKADFLYKIGSRVILEDTKGMATDVYKIKLKLLIGVLAILGYEFREVKRPTEYF